MVPTPVRSHPARGVTLSEAKDLLSRPAPVAGDGWEHVARLSELEGRGLLGVTLSNGTKVCLALCDDTVAAVRDQCTHQEFPLSEGDLLPNGRITCAWHGAEFDCSSGRVCRGPALEDVETFEAVVRGSDIYVRSR